MYFYTRADLKDLQRWFHCILLPLAILRYMIRKMKDLVYMYVCMCAVCGYSVWCHSLTGNMSVEDVGKHSDTIFWYSLQAHQSREERKSIVYSVRNSDKCV